MMHISTINYNCYINNHKNPESVFNRSLNIIKENQPKWTTIEGVAVLMVPSSSFVAVPCSGKKNSKSFQIIDLNDRSDILTVVNSKEVIGWLARKHIDELSN